MQALILGSLLSLIKVCISLAEPTIVSNSSSIIENSTVTIHCKTTYIFTRWTLNTDINSAYLAWNATSSTCYSTSFILNEPTKYDYSCNKDGYNITYSLTLKNVSINQHGDIWTCQAGLRGEIRNVVVLNISVPVRSVTSNGTDGEATTSTIVENRKYVFKCTTSKCRPTATITWYLANGTNVFELENSNQTYVHGPDSLISTISNIGVNLNRTYNWWNLACKAENIENYKPAFHNVTLNITFPTTKPIIHCTNSGVFKVIQNHKGNLSCSVDGGNPAGILQWNCSGNITEQHGPNNNVSQTIVWTAKQTQYCTCSSTNIAGTRSTSVYIDVLYTPVLSDIRNQIVFEGDSVVLQCDVIRANPPVYMTRWTSNKHNVTSKKLSLPNVTGYDDMIYTCTVYNTMDPSCHHVVQGNTSKSIHLEVLYQPSVNITSGKSFTVKEGDTFKYTCPVVPGNPTTTNVTWKRSKDAKVWTSSELLIHNISRYDDNVYTCYVTNVMVHSNGTTKLGHASADIRLIVHYSASVTYFHVRNYPDNTIIVVMEHTSLTLECRVQGNPTADVKIYKFENEVKRSNTNKLLYDTTAACSGTPVLYSCHGYNTLNNKPSTREVQISVKCTPRPDPNVNIQYKATSAINHTVTISYTALAYPYPTFIWYRNGSSKVIDNPRITISSLNLATNLTISQVEEKDFGQYVVNATNDVGSNIIYMYLKPQGVPEVPTIFTQINSTTTDSNVTLAWTPGFNNGLEQTFTLMYRKQPDGTWQSINVNDTGGKTISYNITGLTPNTTYGVILFAFNDLELMQKSTGGSSASAIAGAAGGSAAGIVLILGVIIGVIIFKRRFVNTSKSTASEQTPSTSPVTYENLNIDPIPNEPPERQNETSGNHLSETNVDHTYEGLSARNNGKENEYSSLAVKSNTDAKVTYENLKI